jgi:hypothetical protein
MKRITKTLRREALAVVGLWRGSGVPSEIPAGEAWLITGGLVGEKDANASLSLAQVAMEYVRKEGSTADALALMNGETR